MKTFLIDEEKTFSYPELLSDINNTTSYFAIYKTSTLYDYLLNLIVALLVNKPLLLIDSDINLSEIDIVDSELINRPISIPRIQVGNIDEVLKLIRNSTSEISIFTSGTTGQPKKVIHTVQTLTRTVRISDKFSNQTWGFAYNSTHMAGLQVFFQAFLNENVLVNLFNNNRSKVYEAFDKYSITHISATPTFYRLLLPVENSYIQVKRVTLGGEKSENKLYESILKIFPNAKINNIYASTEAGALFSAKGENFQIPESIIEKIKVEDDELLIHRSLLGKSDSFIFSGEYYCTGDLIEWVNKVDGLFRFKSRKNELVNIGGYKVNPSEVESVLLEIPDVLQVVVYGKPNSVLGNILCAEVKLHSTSELTELNIRNILFDKLQDFKIPRRIKFVDTFSLTRTGKIKRI